MIWWTDKDNIVYRYNEVLFGLKNMTGSSAICKKRDEPWEHYPQWNKAEGQIAYDTTTQGALSRQTSISKLIQLLM